MKELIAAAEQGDIDTVRRLIEQGAVSTESCKIL